MKIQITKLDPENELGPDLVLMWHDVPESGGAVIISDNSGHKMVIEHAPSGCGFVLSPEDPDGDISLVPYEDGTSFKVKVS